MHHTRKINKLSFFSVIAFVLVISLTFINFHRLSSQAIVGNCSGISISVSPSASGTVLNNQLSGIVSVDINTSTTSPDQIGKIVIFARDNSNIKKVIGRAQVAGMNKWNFQWATALWQIPNNQVKLSAEVVYLGNGGSCTVDSTTQYNVSNTVPTSMTITLVGQTEPAFVGSTYDYNVIGKIDDPLLSSFELTRYSVLEWSQTTNIGFLSSNNFPNDTQVKYNAGLVPGSNRLSVRVIYGGADITKSIPLTVKPLVVTSNSTNSATSSTVGTTTTNNQSSISSPTTSSNTATTTQFTSSQVQITPVTKSCVEEVLTTKRYSEIHSGDSRPTADELDKIATCFAPSKYILPSNFSPIEPVKVSNLGLSDKISVSNLENVTKKVGSKDQQTLKITGKATPNSTVIFYIFSDPLVITTKSDGDGNWQYTIEDPLEPGKHEVYAIVDNGDGVYKRSDPMSFLISTASASAANPNGLSLKLSEPPKKTPTQSTTNLIIYVAGSVALLAIAFACLYMIVRSHHKHKVIIAQINKKSEVNNPEHPKNNDLVDDVNKIESEGNSVGDIKE